MQRRSASIKFRRFLTGLGMIFILLAISSNLIGLTRGPVDKDRLMLGGLGALVLCVGLFGVRVFSVYRWTILNIANTVVLLLALEIGATFIHRITPAEDVADDAAAREVGGTSVERQLYVGWRAGEFSGEAINIDATGKRLTPPELTIGAQESIEIFAFGGSTMWGEGSKDNETIPACLQKLLCESGIPTRVTNFGQRAWVSTQSFVELSLQLHRGNVPDIVVFYDGYNETTAAWSTGQIGVPENFEGLIARDAGGLNSASRWFSQTELGRLLALRREFVPPQTDVAVTAESVVANYAAVHKSVAALGETYGFDVHFYWQPQLCIGAKPLTDEELAMSKNHPWLPRPVKELSRETYRLAAQLSDNCETITDISDAFAGMKDRVYIDPCHVLPPGNQRVAEAMLSAGLRETVNMRAEERIQSTAAAIFDAF